MSFEVVDIPVVTQRLVHTVSLTIEIHQFVFDKVIDVPLCRSCLPCPLCKVQTLQFRGGAAVAVPAWCGRRCVMQRPVPGSSGPDHRQNVQGLRRGFYRTSRHFSASVLLDVEAQGGGDARSLTPRCPATNSMHACGCKVEHTFVMSEPPPPPPPLVAAT